MWDSGRQPWVGGWRGHRDILSPAAGLSPLSTVAAILCMMVGVKAAFLGTFTLEFWVFLSELRGREVTTDFRGQGVN